MALSKAARRPKRGINVLPSPLEVKVKASTQIWMGGLVVLDASGWAKPGVTATGLKAWGIAKASYLGTAVDGAVIGEVWPGTFKFANSGGDPVVQADQGALCYIVDDETVCHTATGKSVAGLVIQVDSDGVWVQVVPGAKDAG